MEIDDIMEFLCNGTKDQIKKIIKENKISYSFGKSGTYTVENGKTMEGIRGTGIINPNCVKYFGNNYKNS